MDGSKQPYLTHPTLSDPVSADMTARWHHQPDEIILHSISLKQTCRQTVFMQKTCQLSSGARISPVSWKPHHPGYNAS